MAPEAPGNLVVLDLQYRDADLIGYVERVESNSEFLQVSWHSRRKPRGYFSVGYGIAYGKDSSNLERTPRTAAAGDSLGTSGCSWRDIALGDGMMFVLILPKGYTLTNPEPTPVSSKLFKGRLALYWFPTERYGERRQISWMLKSFSGDLNREVERINREGATKRESHSARGVLVVDSDTRSKGGSPGSLFQAVYDWVNSLPRWRAVLGVVIILISFAYYAFNSLAKSHKEQLTNWLLSALDGDSTKDDKLKE